MSYGNILEKADFHSPALKSTLPPSLNIQTSASTKIRSFDQLPGRCLLQKVQKKTPPHVEHKAELKKQRRHTLVVLGTLFLDKFNEQFQVFRIHIRQNAVAEIEDVAGMFGMLTK